MKGTFCKAIKSGIGVEFAKCKHTWVYWSLVAVILLCVWLAHITIVGLGGKQINSTITAWAYINERSFTGLFTLIFPVAVSILVFMIYQVDHQANTWKHLYALPLPRWSVFIYKTVFSFILIGLSIFLFSLMMLIDACIIDLEKPSWGINHYASAYFLQLLPTALKGWVATFGFFTIQNWLSYRFRNFALPVFIGVAGSVAGTFSPATWPEVVNFPYAFPILTMQATNEADGAAVLLKSVGVGLMVIFISALDAENFYKGKMA
jgi:lantibiotic transport system permease protein